MNRAVVVACLAAMLGMASHPVAQSPAAPAFEVASVRAIPPSVGLPQGFAKNPRRVGPRLTWTTDLFALVRYAFDIPNWRITGIKSERVFYRVEALMEATASQEEVRAMLRQLLIDRFNLKTHTEVEERSGYDLVVINGSKLQRAAATGEVPPMPDYMKGQPSAAFEGSVFISAEGLGVSALTGRGVPLARLAHTLSEALEEFVVDRTGTTANYYFGFTFRRLVADAVTPEVPALYEALREHLGLKLERRRGPVEFLLVDHAERTPSEN